jgi:hypothetical protein
LLLFGFSRRVARWHIFEPKILIWVNFGGTCNGRCWYTSLPFRLFYSHLIYFVAIGYILLLFGIFSILVCCTKTNLATLFSRRNLLLIGCTFQS